MSARKMVLGFPTHNGKIFLLKVLLLFIALKSKCCFASSVYDLL